MSQDPFLQVLVSVLVLEPSSLSLGLGPWRLAIGHSWSLQLRQKCDSDTSKLLHPLLEKVFCLPVTSAPAERIFSHSGLLMWAKRPRMSNKMLSQLIYLQYNNKL